MKIHFLVGKNALGSQGDRVLWGFDQRWGGDCLLLPRRGASLLRRGKGGSLLLRQWLLWKGEKGGPSEWKEIARSLAKRGEHDGFF